MKRCPACRRDYYDDSLLYCLDDGSGLLEGPKSEPPASAGGQFDGEPQTAILAAQPAVGNEQQTVYLQPSASAGGSDRRKGSVWLLAALGIAVLLLAGFFGYRNLNSTSKQIDSIAVMPFVNESGNTDVDYLSDGMTETLIATLTKVPNLNVKARSSVFRYKGKEVDPRTLGRELNVQAILNGRVAKRGEQLTLTLELVDVATENAIWSQQYSRMQSDVASLQSEIARDVSGNLRSKLSGADESKLTKNYTADPHAYELYLRGRFLLNQANPQSQEKSVEFFQQAIDIDPKFANAYSSMADAYTLLGTVFNAQMPPAEAIGRARAAAQKALQLDPDLSDVYASLAWIEFRFDWDWQAAENDFKKAIQLDPKSAHAHQWYGEFLGCMKRSDEGIRELRTARDLEPFSALITWNLGKNLFDAGYDDEALIELNRSLELDPNFSRALRFSSIIYEKKGLMKEAFAAYLKQPEIATLSPDKVKEITETFNARGMSAARRKGAELYLEVTNTAAQRAIAYLFAGNKKAALEWLEKAYAEHNGTLVGLKSERGWDGLRDEPAFQQLIARMNFPEVPQRQ